MYCSQRLNSEHDQLLEAARRSYRERMSVYYGMEFVDFPLPQLEMNGDGDLVISIPKAKPSRIIVAGKIYPCNEAGGDVG